MEETLNFSQQFKLLRPEAVRPVTLIGAGAVGSQVAVMLSKMGVPRLAVWDDDAVSAHNVPMSAYRPKKDCLRPKVDALREIVEEASGLVIDGRRERHTGTQPLEATVVICVDDMDERQRLWRRVRNDPAVELVIDTRTAAQLISVFAVCPCDPDDIELYDHYTAYGKKDATEHFCGQHGCMPVSLRAASVVGANLTGWWMSGKKKLHHQELVLSLDTVL